MKTLNSFSLSVSSGSGVRLRPASCSEICGSRKLPPWQTWRVGSLHAPAGPGVGGSRARPAPPRVLPVAVLGEDSPALADLADRLDQRLGGAALGEIAGRPGLERAAGGRSRLRGRGGRRPPAARLS